MKQQLEKEGIGKLKPQFDIKKYLKDNPYSEKAKNKDKEQFKHIYKNVAPIWERVHAAKKAGKVPDKADVEKLHSWQNFIFRKSPEAKEITENYVEDKDVMKAIDTGDFHNVQETLA